MYFITNKTFKNVDIRKKTHLKESEFLYLFIVVRAAEKCAKAAIVR
jgi:hypothetical protein